MNNKPQFVKMTNENSLLSLMSAINPLTLEIYSDLHKVLSNMFASSKGLNPYSSKDKIICDMYSSQIYMFSPTSILNNSRFKGIDIFVVFPEDYPSASSYRKWHKFFDQELNSSNNSTITNLMLKEEETIMFGGGIPICISFTYFNGSFHNVNLFIVGEADILRIGYAGNFTPILVTGGDLPESVTDPALLDLGLNFHVSHDEYIYNYKKSFKEAYNPSWTDDDILEFTNNYTHPLDFSSYSLKPEEALSRFHLSRIISSSTTTAQAIMSIADETEDPFNSMESFADYFLEASNSSMKNITTININDLSKQQKRELCKDQFNLNSKI